MTTATEIMQLLDQWCSGQPLYLTAFTEDKKSLAYGKATKIGPIVMLEVYSFAGKFVELLGQRMQLTPLDTESTRRVIYVNIPQKVLVLY